MGKTNYPGIDYGMGQANVDVDNGIRYGVIHHSKVGSAWYDSAEGEYGDPCCPKCGNESVNYDDEKHGDYETERGCCEDYACEGCEIAFDLSDDMSEPIGHYVKDEEIHAYQGYDDCDIMVFKSPYYTVCQFCSPCAPGAGYLLNTCENGVKTYCFGPDWFDENKCPYPVYEVGTDKLIYSPAP